MLIYPNFVIFVLQIFFFTQSQAKIDKALVADNLICRNISNLALHPLDCCCYPRFIDNPDNVRDKCHNKCTSMPSDFHCTRNCVITESGVIVEGVMNPKAVTSLFYECSEDDEEMEPVSEAWRRVIGASVKKCDVEVTKRKEIEADQYNFHYSRLVECVRKENFLNCPNYKDDDQCQLMKKMITSCRESNYEFLHEILFEDFYYRSKETKEERRQRLFYDDL